MLISARAALGHGRPSQLRCHRIRSAPESGRLAALQKIGRVGPGADMAL